MSLVFVPKLDIGKLRAQDVPENVVCVNATLHVFVLDVEKNSLLFLNRKKISREKNNIISTKIIGINIMKQCLLIMLVTLGFLPFVGCSTPTQDTSQLKEELKQEILAELRQQQTQPQPSQITTEQNQEQIRAQMKEEIEQEIMAKIQNQVQSQVKEIASDFPDVNNRSIQWQAVPVGSAEGKILRNGQGLAACKVKLIRILKPQSVVEMFNTIREGVEFTTVTDEQGKYVFDNLPVGAYKLKWQLPNDQGWIRRLRDKPDAIITKGQATVLNPVETNRRLVSQ
jgi:hypothetical protein